MSKGVGSFSGGSGGSGRAERPRAGSPGYPARTPSGGSSGLANRLIRRYGLFATLLVAVVLLLLLVPKVSTSSQVAPTTTSRPPLAPGITRPAPAGTPGVTVGGYHCAPGIRQVPWSKYAPICEPKWHGKNGGATSNGVTATTIRVAYRLAATSELGLLYAIVPPAVIGTNAEAVSTMEAYIATFNRTYELYGRHVVLVPFTGKGNFIQEDTGTGAPQAEADAENEENGLHAFADMSLIGSSQMFSSDLAADHVVTESLYVENRKWYTSREPYAYSVGPTCTQDAEAIGAIFGKGLAGLPAAYAGTAKLRSQAQKIGIFYPTNPQASRCVQEIDADLARYGVHPAAQIGFAFDLSTLLSEVQTAIGRFKQAGVTTVICSACDPITPVFFTRDEAAVGYYPEMFLSSYFALNATAIDRMVTLLTPKERSQVISIGSILPPYKDEEAVKAFEMGATPGEKIIPSYPFVYASLLPFFAALQVAGPDLTPASFEWAWQHLPPSLPGGMFGMWRSAPGKPDVSSGFEIVKWSATAKSPMTGKAGSFVACNGGKEYRFSTIRSVLPAHTQLSCPTSPPVAP